VSTFWHRTVRKYNNTNCTYGVNLQHEGSISELHIVQRVFSLARARTVLVFLQTIIPVRNSRSAAFEIPAQRSKSPLSVLPIPQQTVLPRKNILLWIDDVLLGIQ
jgi:hypothetical protein